MHYMTALYTDFIQLLHTYMVLLGCVLVWKVNVVASSILRGLLHTLLPASLCQGIKCPLTQIWLTICSFTPPIYLKGASKFMWKPWLKCPFESCVWRAIAAVQRHTCTSGHWYHMSIYISSAGRQQLSCVTRCVEGGWVPTLEDSCHLSHFLKILKWNLIVLCVFLGLLHVDASWYGTQSHHFIVWLKEKAGNDETAGIISVVQQIVQYLWSSSLVYKQAAVLWERNKAPPFSLSIPHFLCDLLESKSL